MKYVVLGRVSTGEQLKSGLSLEAQKASCMKWIEMQECQGPTNIWIEDGTGTDKRLKGEESRDILMEAIETLEPGDVFVVHSRCRLARNIYMIAIIERLIQRKKAKLVAVNCNNDDDANGMLMRAMVDAFAMYEAMLISERTTRALQAKKARGERVGYIPFGQRVGAGDKLVANLEEQRIIRQIKKLSAEGQSLRNIVDILNDAGHTNRGSLWQRDSVRNIVKKDYTS